MEPINSFASCGINKGFTPEASRHDLPCPADETRVLWAKRCAPLVIPVRRGLDSIEGFLSTRFDTLTLDDSSPLLCAKKANFLCDPYVNGVGEPDDEIRLRGCTLPLTPRNIRLIEDGDESACARRDGYVAVLFWEESCGFIGGTGAACHTLMSEALLYLGVSVQDIYDMTPRYYAYIEELARRGALPQMRKAAK